MSRHSLDVLTWPHSQMASDFMGGGSLHQPPPTDTALLYACSRGWLGWKSGHFELANTPGFGKEVNDAKLQNKSTTRKAVITACWVFLCPFPLQRHPGGFSRWRTAVKAAVQQAGSFLSDCWLPLYPGTQRQNCLLELQSPDVLPWSQPCFTVTSPLNLWQRQGPPWDTRPAQDPAVLHERQCRNNCLPWASLGRWEKKL